jgi:hypothetical protein
MGTATAQLLWTVTGQGELTCSVNGITYAITEHHLSDNENCGYDLTATRVGEKKPFKKDFIGSLNDVIEAMDYFMFLCEEGH